MESFGTELEELHRQPDGKNITSLDEAEEDRDGVLAELVKVQKAAVAVRRFCLKWASSGPNSQATLQVFDEQMAWCSQGPVIPSPFPLYILHHTWCEAQLGLAGNEVLVASG